MTAALASWSAAAQPAQGSCCTQRTSYLDGLINPARGSDEKFFAQSSGMPNVMFILDTSGSMNAWPQNWPTSGNRYGGPTGPGCNHPDFAGAGFDPAASYRGLIRGINISTGEAIPNDNWFNDNRVYQTPGSTGVGDSAIGFNFGGHPGGQNNGYPHTSIANGCNTTYVGASNAAACTTCLQTRGYYVVDNSRRVATGKFLKYYAPRDVSAVMVLSQLLYDVQNVRFGILTFDNWNGSNDNSLCWRNASSSMPLCLWQPTGSGVNHPMTPTCNKHDGDDSPEQIRITRDRLLQALNTQRSWNSSTPLAPALYAAGYYFRGNGVGGDAFANLFPSRPTPVGSTVFGNSDAHGGAVCEGCNLNAVVALTDGDPNNDTHIGPLPSGMTNLYSTVTQPLCNNGTFGQCQSALDEVAAYLNQMPDWDNGANSHRDLRPDMPGRQRIVTYTIGFGTGAGAEQLLRSAATAGGGSFYRANSAGTLASTLNDIFSDIEARNNSFASASVASVQTGSSSTAAILPRVLPRSDAAWQGQLWRFKQFNEFVENIDLNEDGDRNDTFMVERVTPEYDPDGNRTETLANIVEEDENGVFRKKGTAVRADEYWEANTVLSDAGSPTNPAGRRIWTVLDQNNDGRFTEADGLVSVFTSLGSNNETLETTSGAPGTLNTELDLAAHMGLRGSQWCPSSSGNGLLVDRLGRTPAFWIEQVGLGGPGSTIGGLTQEHRDLLCVRLVILWVRGADLFDENNNGHYVDEMRRNPLGDIFHSSPISVDPPVDPFLCDLGLSTQCALTLYSRRLGVKETDFAAPEPITVTASDGDTCTRTASPYDWWHTANAARDKVVLVGANDGMLHAFHNGTGTVHSCAGGLPLVRHNQGTGRELWAFISPDQLPRLTEQMFTHTYMMDGDIMVRDIWADGSGTLVPSPNGIKERDEFHTLAVASQGRGGNHYVALEVKFGTNGAAADHPGFRWMFPQPCSTEAATFGKTFLSISPKAPPIGPILLDATVSDFPSQVGVPTTPINRYGVPNTMERWVVALSGGWSPGLERGRGVYMVDAWSSSIGERRDNLWWKYEFNPSAPSNDPSRALRYSVTAPVALVDYGHDSVPGQQDGFFDSAVWGDTGGQVWMTRIAEPGRWDEATQRISNWSTARVFEMDKQAGGGNTDITNKQPFYYLPSVTVESATNRMRVFLGSGNRYDLLEEKAGICRYDNLTACSKYQCQPRMRYRFRDGLSDYDSSMTWGNRTFNSATSTQVNHVAVKGDLLGSNTCQPAEAELVNYDAQCGGSPVWTSSTNDINETRYSCEYNADNSGYVCRRQSELRNGNLGDLADVADMNDTGLGNNRFIGFWAYGGAHLGTLRTFGGDGGMPLSDFDDARLSESDLQDVTPVNCTVNGCTGAVNNEDGLGWYLTYDARKQKTAAGSAVISSCILWSDIDPNGGVASVCNPSVATPASNLYQADFVTGASNCAVGFLSGSTFARSVHRTVVSPPPEPASVVQVSKTGQVKYSAMIIEAGQNQATTADVSTASDMLQVVYELPISRGLHTCRHNEDGNCIVSP